MASSKPNNETVLTEEEIMKNRLLYDGDAQGDDRRFKDLLKSFIKFTTPKTGDDAKEENLQKEYDKIINQLDTCLLVFEKNELITETNQNQLDNYKETYAEFEESYAKMEENIKKYKLDLIEAKKRRKQRMEYDAIAKKICRNPDRKTLNHQLDEVQKKITILENLNKNIDEKLELRKKQFHTVLRSLQEIEETLEEEDDINIDELLNIDTEKS